ncbi:MAG: MBL fold metallo-hydrolase [Actinocatenispora sp.]
MTGCWDEVGERVFRRRYDSFDLNVGVVLGGDAAMVIDTRASAREGRELLAEVRALTSLPVRHVVNTHFHFDHCFGNEVFASSAIWAHRRCAEQLRNTGAAERAAVVDWLTDRAEEMSEVAITPADHLIDTAALVDVGGRSVELRHLGPGHTDHDLVVRVPDAGVLFAGDLLEEGMPPSFGDAWPQDWCTALVRLVEIAPPVVVPGHGDLVGPDFAHRRRQELMGLLDLFTQVEEGRMTRAEVVARSPYPQDHTLAALYRFSVTRRA